MILSKVKESGFTVSLSNETHLTKEMAEQLYSEHRDKDYFEDLTNMMTRQAIYIPQQFYIGYYRITIIIIIGVLPCSWC